MEDSPAATPNASPEFSNLEHSDMEQDNDSGGQWCISGNRKRRQIETTAAALNLRALNDGSATLCRRHTKASTLDITLVSSEIDALWTVEPDTGGSDHFPINVIHPKTAPKTIKECKVVNWDIFRQYFTSTADSKSYTDITTCIAECLQRATRIVKIPATRPTPDLEWLNLRAARRQAQRRALHTDALWDWARYNRIDACFRRHTKKLQRWQWSSDCASLSGPGGGRRAWGLVRALKGAKIPRHPITTLAIKTGQTMIEVAEHLADEFARFTVKIPGATSTSRPISKGVPQGSVLSPLLFNVVMASLPHCLPTNNETLHVGMAIYADDVAMWCEGPSENLRFGGLWSDVVIYYKSYDISEALRGERHNVHSYNSTKEGAALLPRTSTIFSKHPDPSCGRRMASLVKT
ncbi:hypothetical protein HPB47_019742 [Ixodes persulcatus]|uniref:Uncharacterized protein n=1 Tax=Ixodes persulcatus TaxID=34615 RepID=A0AC60QHA8_IXOPE|nr:hypothetical protein HPB47_019742 [Ixodes persulcatus]